MAKISELDRIGTKVINFPGYYIYEGRLYQIVPKTANSHEIQREIVPNPSGKIAMKNSEGEFKIFIFKDIIAKIEDSLDDLADKEEKRKAKLAKDDPRWKRALLKEEYTNLIKATKEALAKELNVDKIFEIKAKFEPRVKAALAALASFDLLNPEYAVSAGGRKKMTPLNRELERAKNSYIASNEDMRAVELKIFELCETAQDKIIRLKEAEKEFVAKFGYNFLWCVKNGYYE